MMLKSVRFTCTYSCILLCNSLNSAFTSEHQRILEAPRVLFSPCARGGGRLHSCHQLGRDLYYSVKGHVCTAASQCSAQYLD